MIQLFAGLAPALVGGVLLLAGWHKLFGRSAPATARRSALSRLVGKERVVPLYRALGGVELAVAAVLLAPPVYRLEAGAAVVLTVGFVGYLGYAMAVAPESSCGCLSDRPMPVRWRSLGRAGLLVVASAMALAGTEHWASALAGRPVAAVTVLVAGVVLVAVLSPEADRYWLVPLRRLRVRLSHPLAGQPFEVPVEATVQQLLRSAAYQAVTGWLRSDLVDSWDDGEWRMLTYTAGFAGRPATAVFAVSRLRYEPERVRVAIVDEDDQDVLWRFEPGSGQLPVDGGGALLDEQLVDLAERA